MMLCKTDTERLIRLLDSAADIIDKHVSPSSYKDRDKARQLRQFRNKIIRKQDGKNNQ